MSSREWIEVATAAEARSLRRWAARRAAPILSRYFIFMLLIGVAGLVFGELLYSQIFAHNDHRCYPTLDGVILCAKNPIRFGDIFEIV